MSTKDDLGYIVHKSVTTADIALAIGSLASNTNPLTIDGAGNVTTSGATTPTGGVVPIGGVATIYSGGYVPDALTSGTDQAPTAGRY